MTGDCRDPVLDTHPAVVVFARSSPRASLSRLAISRLAVVHMIGFEDMARVRGNPSGARHFTISTALDNDGCEENQHGYDEPDFINSRLFMTSRVYQR